MAIAPLEPPPSTFSLLQRRMQYGPQLLDAIEKTVANLVDNETSAQRPGMLLGKVQSGKTRAYIGVVGLAFDRGFDIAVVLTKGTKALANQTVTRLEDELDEALSSDLIVVHDVMQLPHRFSPWEAGRKHIVVCKKQKDNLRNLRTFLTGDSHRLRGKRVLFVDDEADFASVGFRRANDQIEFAKIALDIDNLRRDLREAGTAPAFLQVTATPYSLYLQPEMLRIEGRTFERTRPVFTTLVPVHRDYVGSDFFFDEDHQHRQVAQHCYVPIEDVEELTAMRRPDGRRVKETDVLVSKAVRTLRKALVLFVVGGMMRQLIAKDRGTRAKHYAFIVHTETARGAHAWQASLVDWLVDALRNTPPESPLVRPLIVDAWENLSRSILAGGQPVPSLAEVMAQFRETLDEVAVDVVNSEKDVESMLDKNGQLRLTSPLKIFVGGQILDRGITVANLIGFFYGRDPKRFQQDTVLQHARLFGARPLDDMAVTRFYTTRRIHTALRRIHEIDTALREAFENGHESGVVFIQRDMQKNIVPCAPNKILLSNTVTLRPHRRMLPVGFQTRTPKRDTLRVVEEIDAAVENVVPTREGLADPVLVDAQFVVRLLDRIEATLESDPDCSFDWSAMRASIEHLAPLAENRGKIWLIVRKDRDVPRTRVENGVRRDMNAPDTSQREGRIARELSSDRTPVLMLLRQNGREANGWRGCPFWWPVMLTPKNMKPVIFSGELSDDAVEVDEDDAF